jgi:hypothetical protein
MNESIDLVGASFCVQCPIDDVRVYSMNAHCLEVW